MPRIRSHFTTFLAMLGLAVVLIVLDQSSRLDAPQDWGQRLMGPVEAGFSALAQEGSSLVATGRDLRGLRADNAAMQDQLDRLTLVYVQSQELREENERLRELLRFQEANPNFTLQAAEVIERGEPARVIGVEPSSLVQAVRINQGRESGVETGMSVITPSGLVGQVTQSGQGWAQVLLVTDTTSQVTAFVQEGRASGVVEGTGEGLIMRYIPHEQQVEPGDVVLSAGLGGKFPKGLVIGTIESVRRSDINPAQEAVIRSAISFNRLEYVFVIRSFRAPSEDAAPTPTP